MVNTRLDHYVTRTGYVRRHVRATGICEMCHKPVHLNQWNAWVHDDYLETANDHDVKRALPKVALPRDLEGLA